MYHIFFKIAICAVILAPRWIIAEDTQLVSPILVELLEKTNVTHSGSLDSIVENTQKKWLRPLGKERWEIPCEYSSEIIDLAKKLKFIDEIKVTGKNFKYAVVLGCTFMCYKARFEYMVDLWNQGIRFEKIVFLTGQRLLDPILEGRERFKSYVTSEKEKIPQNETEMAYFVYEHTIIPKKMRELPFEVVSVEMPGEGRPRPNTGDVIRKWVENDPGIQNVLFISSQPYCLYQNAVAKKYLQGKEFETVGFGITNSYAFNTRIVLDSIGRFLYQERENSR